MSTILDALRKLQRERAAQHPSRDLRGSVTDEIPVGAPVRGRRRGLAAGLVLLLLAAAGGGAWLYRSGKLAASTDESLAVESAPGEGDRPATDEEFAQIERETLEFQQRQMDEATAAEPETPAPVAASPESVEPAPPVDPAAEADAERARLEAVQAEALAAAEAQRQAETEAAARAAAPPAPPVAVPAPEPEPAPEVTPAAPPVIAAAPPKAEPKPKAKPAAKPKPESQPERSARRAEPEPDYESLAALAPVFPPVRVESIRWHPLAERRVASLRFEQQNVPDAHEGDIVAGVLVYRIDPGAVELRVGSTSRVIRPVP